MSLKTFGISIEKSAASKVLEELLFKRAESSAIKNKAAVLKCWFRSFEDNSPIHRCRENAEKLIIRWQFRVVAIVYSVLKVLLSFLRALSKSPELFKVFKSWKFELQVWVSERHHIVDSIKLLCTIKRFWSCNSQCEHEEYLNMFPKMVEDG